MNPTVSVIIPAYNAESFIRAALDSASAQTLADIEIIVVDDGSTDATAAAVSLAAATDPRIRLVNKPHNAGLSEARNTGIEQSRGTWLAFLDADDTMVADRLEELVALGNTAEADIVSDNLQFMRPETLDHAPLLFGSEVATQSFPMSLTMFLQKSLPSPNGGRCRFVFMHPMFRRAFIERSSYRYDPECNSGGDFALYIEMLADGAAWWVHAAPMYRYFIHDTSMSMSAASDDPLDRFKVTHALERAMSCDEAIKAPALRHALQKHWEICRSDYEFRRFKDSVRQRDYNLALRQLMSPQATRMIAQRAVQAAPAYLRKRIRRLTAR